MKLYNDQWITCFLELVGINCPFPHVHEVCHFNATSFLTTESMSTVLRIQLKCNGVKNQYELFMTDIKIALCGTKIDAVLMGAFIVWHAGSFQTLHKRARTSEPV